MYSKIIFIIGLFITTSSWAGPHVSEGPGPVGTYKSCKGNLEDGSKITFEVRATAAPTIVDAVLIQKSTNLLINHFYCKKGEPSKSNVPYIEWLCNESGAANKMGMSVELMSGGFVGSTTGQVKLEQIFPLEPKVVGSLFCK